MSHIRIRSKTTSTWVTVQPLVSWQQHKEQLVLSHVSFMMIMKTFGIISLLSVLSLVVNMKTIPNLKIVVRSLWKHQTVALLLLLGSGSSSFIDIMWIYIQKGISSWIINHRNDISSQATSPISKNDNVTMSQCHNMTMSQCHMQQCWVILSDHQDLLKTSSKSKRILSWKKESWWVS